MAKTEKRIHLHSQNDRLVVLIETNRGVAERSNAAVLKTVEPQGSGGSNPSSSAKPRIRKEFEVFCLSGPFVGFKMTKREVERPFLVEEELNRIIEKTFLMARMSQVRDIFIFCCYTGLAYADVEKLTREEITTGIIGEKWIWTSRQKTESTTRIPLLPPAIEILDRYKNDPQCLIKKRLLPVLTNQKMNTYLKEIADACNITKKMTFHTARHTFATTVTLTNGVPIETVSKMLGHRNLKTTQHYAKILDLKVSTDMSVLRMKYKKGPSDKSKGEKL